jgi:membrane associated rhomboid family serine protease
MLPVRDSLPTRLAPVVNYALIALNLGAFAKYLACGLVAALAQVAMSPQSIEPMLGASGAVAFVAHVGGFVGGLVLSPLLRTQKPVEYSPWDRLLGPRRNRLSS